MSKKTDQKALNALLEFVTNEGDKLYGDGENDDRVYARFSKLRVAWLNAGCPGIDNGPRRPLGPSVKVRIAVVQRGKAWSASGFAANDEELASVAWHGLEDVEDGPERLDWGEAFVPAPPEPTVVEGRVVEE